MTVYDYIDGEPLLDTMTVEEAEPIIDYMITLAINEINYQTGCDVERKWFEEDLADAEWIYSINDGDEPCRIDMELCEKQIDIITERYIREIKEDQERDAMTAGPYFKYSTVYTANDGINGSKVQHTGILDGYTTWALLKWNGVSNIDGIKDKDNIHKVIIDEDTNKVIETNGFTFDRGLFCDVY